ncbi:monocarboxylate transporter 13 isoform 2-T2 [Polymixia lowei]
MTKSKAEAQSTEAEGPDGGWGWVLVGALFVCATLVFGLIRSLGVFFVEFVQYFEESAQAISWITSIGVATQQLFSLGWAMVFTPMVATVMANFTRRRSLALGLGFSGIGLSSFIFSPLFQLLVETYAWRGALLILGALSLNIVPCGALIRPHRRTKAPEKTDSESKSCTAVLRRVYCYLELSLLGERPFLTYSLAVCLFNAGYFVPYVHLVAHSRQAGFSEYQAAFVMSATGATDIVGRVVSGWFSDLGHTRLLHMLTLWTTSTGAFMMLIPLGSLAGSYPFLLVLSLFYGFCAGALTSLVFTVVPEIVGLGRMVGALGLLQLLESVAGLLGAPLSGLLRDLTGNYTASLMVAGSFLILGSTILTTLPHYFSCTAPPPPQRHSPGVDGKDPLESGPMNNSSSAAGHVSRSETPPRSENDRSFNGLGPESKLLKAGLEK